MAVSWQIDPLFQHLVQARHSPDRSALSFPELLLRPEEGRSVRSYSEGALYPQNPLFAELNRWIDLLEADSPIKTAYSDFVEKVCGAEGEERWRWLKGEVRFVAHLRSGASCFLVPKKIRKEVSAWVRKDGSFEGSLAQFLETVVQKGSTDALGLFIDLPPLRGEVSWPHLMARANRTDLIELFSHSLPQGEASSSCDAPSGEMDEILSLERAADCYLEAKEYRLASIALARALSLADSSPLLEQRLNAISNFFVADAFQRQAPATESQIGRHRARLEEIQKEVIQLIERGEPIDKVQALITRHYQELLSTLFVECLKLVGPLSARFTLVALDAFSRQELLFSSGMKVAILVEEERSIPFFQALADLLELKIGQLGSSGFLLQRNRSIMVDLPERLAAYSLDHSRLLGEEELIARYEAEVNNPKGGKKSSFFSRKRVCEAQALPFLRLYLKQWRSVQSQPELDLEQGLYRPLLVLLRALLLYFDKRGLSTRTGIAKLPFSPESQTALLSALDAASLAIINDQLQMGRVKAAVIRTYKQELHHLLSSLYAGISAFIERRKEEVLSAVALRFTPEIHASEAEVYQSFVDAVERRDFSQQISSLRRLATFSLERKDYRRALLVLNSAYAVAQDRSIPDKVRRGLLDQLGQIEEQFIRERVKEPPKYQNRIHEYRTHLAQIRARITSLAEKDLSSSILKELTEAYKKFLSDLLSHSIRAMGQKPPVEFAMAGLGSMSRSEMSLYSDIEFVFLIEGEREGDRAYFRTLSELMVLRIINLGETEFKLIRSDRGERSLTPNGFRVDMGGLTPLGKEGIYELIGTPLELAQFQEEEWLRRNEAEIILVNALRSVCPIAGSEGLVVAYRREVERVLSGEIKPSSKQSLRNVRALELMEGSTAEFGPQLDENKVNLRAFDIKRELCRPFNFIINELSIYYGLKSANTISQIDELQKMGVIGEEGANQIKRAFELILKLRLQAHLFYKSEKEILYAPLGESDPSAAAFLMTPKLSETLIEIYRTLVPLHRAALEFLAGNQSAFSAASFYDPEVGQYDERLREGLQFDAAFRSALVSASLNLNSAKAQSELGIAQLEIAEDKKAIAQVKKTLALLKVKHGDEPHVDIANALNNLGVAYTNLGQYQKATDSLKAALDHYNKLNRSQPTLTLADVLHNFGVLYSRLNHFNAAIECYNDALSIKRGVSGQENLNTASTLCNLGGVYKDLGEYPKAIECYRSALSTQKKSCLGQPHPHLVTTLDSLGNVYKDLNDFTQAAKYYRASLEMAEAIHCGRPHPSISGSLNNLGLLHRALANFDQSFDYLKRALEIDLKIYKSGTHPTIAGVLLNLGTAYLEQGQLGQAMDYYHRSLEMKRKIYGDSPSFDIAISWSALGNGFIKLGDPREAINCYNASLAILEKLFPNGSHGQIASNLDGLGTAYHHLQDIGPSIEHYRRSISMKESIYQGRAHTSIAISLNNLASVYKDLGDFKEAIEQYNRALAILREAYQHQPHRDVARVLMMLGKVHQQLEQFPPAIHLFTDALSNLEGDKPDSMRALVLMSLGNSYSQLGDLEQSIHYLTLSLLSFQQIHKDQPHESVATLLSTLGFLYKLLGDVNQSIDHLTSSLGIFRTLYPDQDHAEIAKISMTLGALYLSSNKFDPAIEHLEPSCSMFRRVHGDEKVDLIFAEALNHLGVAYMGVGKFDQAVIYYTSSMKAFDQLHGGKVSLPVVKILHNLGNASKNLDQLDRAIEYYSASLQMRHEVCGEELDLEAINTQESLGQARFELGQFDDALFDFQSALLMRKQLCGDSDPRIVSTLINLGHVWRAVGELQEAYGSFMAALLLERQIYGDPLPGPLMLKWLPISTWMIDYLKSAQTSGSMPLP